MNTKSIRSRRALKQRVCGTISLVASISAAVFYTGFAHLHDIGAEPMIQMCFLGTVGVSVFLSIASLIIAWE